MTPEKIPDILTTGSLVAPNMYQFNGVIYAAYPGAIYRLENGVFKRIPFEDGAVVPPTPKTAPKGQKNANAAG